MSKLLLNAVTVATLMSYGLKDADSPLDVDNAVAKLKASLDAESTAHDLEKAKRQELEKKVNDQEAAQLGALVDQAVVDGQILANQKQTFIDLGYERAKKLIEGLPKKVTLASKVTNQPGGAEVKTKEDFFKMTSDAQLAFKNESPEAYRALFA